MDKFHGIIVVTVTPFDDKGDIDYAASSKHIKWLLDSGVHGLLPIGATGEFAAFSMEERKAYAEFVMKEAAGRVPVMIGAVSQNVDTVLEIAEHATAAKAGGIMVLSPPALHLSQEEIFAFYKKISENVNIPVMVYNNPGSAGVDIQPDTMGRILKLKHMDYLKESTGDLARLTRMIDDFENDVVTFCGCESLAYESFMMGAKGWISVLANVAPKQCVRLFDLVAVKRDYDAARVIYRQILPMLRLIEESGELWQVAKYALQKRGMGNGTLRAPRLPISDASQRAVDELMRKGCFE